MVATADVRSVEEVQVLDDELSVSTELLGMGSSLF